MDSNSWKRIREFQKPENRNDRAFEKSAEKQAEDPVIFIDPKSLPNEGDYDALDWKAYRSDLVDNFLKQVTDQADITAQEFLDSQGITRAMLYYQIQGKIVVGSPSAGGLEIKGQTYCMIKKPNDDWDTAPDVVNRFLNGREFVAHVDDSVIKNFNITDRQVNSGIAAHEGEHCNQPKEMAGNEKERGADLSEMAQGDDNYDAFVKDLRHLTVKPTSTVHAVGTQLEYGEESTPIHAEAAYYHNNNMALMVYENYDWPEGQAPDPSSYDYETLNTLIQDDPEGFFSAVDKGIEALKADVLKNYKNDSSFDATKDVVRAEASIDFMQNFEAAYRRRFLGQGEMPVPEQTKLIDIDREAFHQDFSDSMDLRAGFDEDDAPAQQVLNTVYNSIDMSAYGGDYDIYDLLGDDPDAYFALVHEAEDRVLQLASDNAGVSDNAEAVRVAEYVIAEMRKAEYDYHTKLGQIVPEPERPDLSEKLSSDLDIDNWDFEGGDVDIQKAPESLETSIDVSNTSANLDTSGLRI